MAKLEVTEEERGLIEKALKKYAESAKKEPSAGNSAPKTEEVKTVTEEKPVYRCRGKDCTYQTLDLGDFIQHTLDERLDARMRPIEEQLGKLSPPKTEETTWEGKTVKRHVTAKEHFDCPDCYPKFRDAALEHPTFLEDLKARGYVKKEEKPKRKGLNI